MTLRRRPFIAAALSIVLLAGVPVQATAPPPQIPPPEPSMNKTMAVYDYINWLQNLLDYYQEYQELVTQYKELEAAYRQFESFANGGDWNSLNGLLGALDGLFNMSDNLGYLVVGVDELFEETFPGWEVPTDWVLEQHERVGRTRETLRLINEALNRLTYANTHSQNQIAELQALAKGADTPLEELEVANMISTFHVNELQRYSQANMLTANAIAVSESYKLQTEASTRAALSDWLARDIAPEPGSDPSEGFTGIAPGHQGWSFL